MKTNFFKSLIALAIILVSFVSCQNDAKETTETTEENTTALKIDGQWEYNYQTQDSSYMYVVDVNNATPDNYYAGLSYDDPTVVDVKFTSKIDSITYSEDGTSGKIYTINADTVYAVEFSDLAENTVTFINKGYGKVQYTRVDNKYTISK